MVPAVSTQGMSRGLNAFARNASTPGIWHIQCSSAPTRVIHPIEGPIPCESPAPSLQPRSRCPGRSIPRPEIQCPGSRIPVKACRPLVPCNNRAAQRPRTGTSGLREDDRCGDYVWIHNVVGTARTAGRRSARDAGSSFGSSKWIAGRCPACAAWRNEPPGSFRCAVGTDLERVTASLIQGAL